MKTEVGVTSWLQMISDLSPRWFIAPFEEITYPLAAFKVKTVWVLFRLRHDPY